MAPRHGWVPAYFGESYRTVYRHLVDETEALRRAAAWVAQTVGWDAGDWVLDLACGYGRHLRHLRHLPGRFAGVDLLHPQLTQARADMRDAPPPLVQADMEALPLRDGALGAVLMLFNSFGYRLLPGETGSAPEQRLLAEIARALRPRGRALLEVPSRDHVLLAVEEQPRVTLGQGDLRLIEDWRVGAGGALLHGATTFLRWGSIERHRFTLRLFSLDEVAALAHDAGLRAVATWGDLRGSPFRGAESDQLVILLEKSP